VRFSAGGGDRGAVQGRLRVPALGATVGTAVLCHPHPAFGGHMDVWLLPTVAERLAEDGWAVLRFDFRSAARSAAVSADGSAEQADLAGALTYLRAAFPYVQRRAIVGWSYGALIGLLQGPHEPDVTDWVGISPPTNRRADLDLPPFPTDVAAWAARRVVITGEHDQFFPADEVGVLAPDVVHIVEGADHFLFDLDRKVADLVAEVLG
jgi:uncharacterized protein